jgi:hypothetical protein
MYSPLGRTKRKWPKEYRRTLDVRPEGFEAFLREELAAEYEAHAALVKLEAEGRPVCAARIFSEMQINTKTIELLRAYNEAPRREPGKINHAATERTSSGLAPKPASAEQ